MNIHIYTFYRYMYLFFTYVCMYSFIYLSQVEAEEVTEEVCA